LKHEGRFVVLWECVRTSGRRLRTTSGSLTPLESAVGKFRFVIRAFLSHVGFIFWPLGAALFVNLLRRRHWAEWLKLAALTTFCLWQAWASTRAAIWVWSVLGRWL